MTSFAKAEEGGLRSSPNFDYGLRDDDFVGLPDLLARGFCSYA